MRHMEYLDAVREADVRTLREKERTYMGSWKAAGGRSAWFMLRRNMDRLLVMMAKPKDPEQGFNPQNARDLAENIGKSKLDHVGVGTVKMHTSPDIYAKMINHLVDSYESENIFAMIRKNSQGEDGTVLACIRDLRCYLTLVEAEMMARGVITSDRKEEPVAREDRDGSQHASVFPHYLSREQYEQTFDEQRRPFADMFYSRRGEFMMLDATVSGECKLPRELALYYARTGIGSWLIRIEAVPDELRDEYPRLPRERNNKEHEDAPEWERSLYQWRDDKWHLQSDAWAAE